MKGSVSRCHGYTGSETEREKARQKKREAYLLDFFFSNTKTSSFLERLKLKEQLLYQEVLNANSKLLYIEKLLQINNSGLHNTKVSSWCNKVTKQYQLNSIGTAQQLPFSKILSTWQQRICNINFSLSTKVSSSLETAAPGVLLLQNKIVDK